MITNSLFTHMAYVPGTFRTFIVQYCRVSYFVIRIKPSKDAKCFTRVRRNSVWRIPRNFHFSRDINFRTANVITILCTVIIREEWSSCVIWRCIIGHATCVIQCHWDIAAWTVDDWWAWWELWWRLYCDGVVVSKVTFRYILIRVLLYEVWWQNQDNMASYPKCILEMFWLETVIP